MKLLEKLLYFESLGLRANQNMDGNFLIWEHKIEKKSTSYHFTRQIGSSAINHIKYFARPWILDAMR